jgi:hypothetical protein
LKCKLCGKEAQAQPQSQYCELHQEAYEKIKMKYEQWKQALSIDWQNYLKEIAQNPYAGAFAKDVAANLLSENRPSQAERNV